MPTLKHDKRSGRDCFFVRAAVDGKDRKIFLGTHSRKQAQAALPRIEDLIEARKLGGKPSAETILWVKSLDPQGNLVKTLQRLQLVDSEIVQTSIDPGLRTLGNFLEHYVETYEGSDRTIKNYKQTKDWLLRHLDAGKPLTDITAEDLIRWARFLKSQGLEWSNREKHIQRAKTMFRAAVRMRILCESPASEVRIESRPGRQVDRNTQFVDEETCRLVLHGDEQKGIKPLPDQFRVVFALLRYQGLRRHEALLLKWNSVDLKAGKITVRSHKTPRVCPIFPETVPWLKLAHATWEGDYVVPWHGDREKADSLTPLFKKHLGRVLGADNVWSDVCQNLRRNRRTELERRFPSHLLDNWLGHSYEIAKEHYLQELETDWQRAISEPEHIDKNLLRIRKEA